MTLLIILTIIEVALLLGVLVFYLARISQRLLSIADTAGKIAFGVRAIDSQTAQIEPAIVGLNEELSAITGALPGIAEKAERVADRG